MSSQHPLPDHGAALLERLPAALHGLVVQGTPAAAPEGAPRWGLAEVAGRLVELSGGADGATLTFALALVADAQGQGENVAWIAATPDLFFPPDAAAAGVDLAALPVVRVADSAPDPSPRPRSPRERNAAARQLGAAAARAATHLLRSGAFALVLLDLDEVPLTTAAQALLVRLAQHHGSAVVCLTRKEGDAPSLGSLVSLHLHTRRDPLRSHGTLTCRLIARKDKRRGPGWEHVARFRYPPGLDLAPPFR